MIRTRRLATCALSCHALNLFPRPNTEPILVYDRFFGIDILNIDAPHLGLLNI